MLSAAARLALRGKGFVNSVEFANAISGGVATELVQEMIVILSQCLMISIIRT